MQLLRLLIAYSLRQALARGMVAAAGARAAASRLADLEARLPADGATKCVSFRFWEAWRRSVARAESAAELAPLVRLPTRAAALCCVRRI